MATNKPNPKIYRMGEPDELVYCLTLGQKALLHEFGIDLQGTESSRTVLRSIYDLGKAIKERAFEDVECVAFFYRAYVRKMLTNASEERLEITDETMRLYIKVLSRSIEWAQTSSNPEELESFLTILNAYIDRYLKERGVPFEIPFTWKNRK